MCKSSVKIVSHEPTEIPQSSAISRTVNFLLLRTIVLTLAIISAFLDVDGLHERGSLSAEVLPSLNRRNQTLVYDPLHLHRMHAAIIDTLPLRFFCLKKKYANALFGTFTHRKNLYDIKAHLLPRPTTTNWANAATCNLCHELLRHIRTCQDWLQTHPTRWTTTTIQIRILFEHTS